MSESSTEIKKIPTVVVSERGNFIMETNSFALRQFNVSLSLLQQRLFYWVFAMVKGDEPIEAQATYKVSMSQMAWVVGNSAKALKYNMKKVVDSMDELNLKYNPPIVLDSNENIMEKSFGVFDKVWISKDEPDAVQVRLTPSFREQVIKMKKQHDIEYPIKTIMQMESAYAIPLYIHLIALVSLEREKNAESGDVSSNYYTISITKENLFQVIGYNGVAGQFNRSILPVIMKNLKETELVFDGDDPEIVKDGRSVAKYVFHVRVATAIGNEIFTKTLLRPGTDNDIPPMDYILTKLKELKVNAPFIKRVRYDNDRVRAWSNYLYTLCNAKVITGAYFNKAYGDDYYHNEKGGNTKALPALFMAMTMEEKARKFWEKDEYLLNMKQEYERLGLYEFAPNSFASELAKHARRNQERHGISEVC